MPPPPRILRSHLLSFTALALLLTTGCGGGPGLSRFEGIFVRIEPSGVGGSHIGHVVSIRASLQHPREGTRDCRLSRTVAFFNGRPMHPIGGVPLSPFQFDNPNCLAPEFMLNLEAQDALSDGGRATIVFEEGGEQVRLVSEALLAPHGPADNGGAPWAIPLDGRLVPWVPAEDDLSALRGSSLREEIGMQSRDGGLWVRPLRGADTQALVLLVEGDVSVGVTECEGIARCTAQVPVHHVIDLRIR